MFRRHTSSLVVITMLAAFGMSAQAQQHAHSTNLRRPTAGYLGIGVTELTDDRAKALSLKDSRGVEVKRVTEDSPAAKAGVKEGDVVVEVNGQAVEGVQDFIQTIAQTAPGTKVSLGIWRKGAKQTVAAMLAERPASQAFEPFSQDPALPPMPPTLSGGDFPFAMGDSPRVGFEGEVLTPQLAAYFGVKEGVLVRTVNSRTPAEKAGIKAGDVVVKVEGMNVATPMEITGIVRGTRKNPVTFTIVRNKKEMTLEVDLVHSIGFVQPGSDRTLF